MVVARKKATGYGLITHLKWNRKKFGSMTSELGTLRAGMVV
jgi:hypothetical protein